MHICDNTGEQRVNLEICDEKENIRATNVVSSSSLSSFSSSSSSFLSYKSKYLLVVVLCRFCVTLVL